jgi:hypothetical protein
MDELKNLAREERKKQEEIRRKDLHDFIDNERRR